MKFYTDRRWVGVKKNDMVSRIPVPAGITGCHQRVAVISACRRNLGASVHLAAGRLPGGRIMDTRLTLGELESRWEKALMSTRSAVSDHPGAYRELKTLAAEILGTSIDINDYFPTVERIIRLLEELDPCDRGSIFQIFKTHISPSSIWHVKMLRMECRDLLAHLNAFDKWRQCQHHLRMVK